MVLILTKPSCACSTVALRKLQTVSKYESEEQSCEVS